MNLTRRHGLSLAAAAALTTAIPVPSAFAQGTDIVFGATLPLSGPFAAVAKDQLEGMRDHFDHVNANPRPQGPLHCRGHPVQGGPGNCCVEEVHGLG
jgi:ABC-type branched-subunit amino acid transport system substrate-binding protein